MTGSYDIEPVGRTRQLLKLPLKDAFNGSLYRQDDGYLLFYNSFNEQGYENRRDYRSVRYCFLDDDFRCRKSSDQDFRVENEGDIRVFDCNGNIYVQSIAKNYEARPKYQIIIRELGFDGDTITTKRSFPIKTVDGKTMDEKNWGFFSRGDELFAVRRVVPHQIVKVDLQQGWATTVYDVSWKPDRKYYRTGNQSLFRGNVTPVPDRGNYLSMFHTRVSRRRFFSKTEYVDFLTGFYLFRSEPPFQVIAYTKPFFSPDDVEPLSRDAGAEVIRCVFPLSLLVNGNKLIVSGGENDTLQCVWTLNLDDVYSCMISV